MALTCLTQTAPFPETSGTSSKDTGNIYGIRGIKRVALQQQAVDEGMEERPLTCRPDQSKHCSK